MRRLRNILLGVSLGVALGGMSFVQAQPDSSAQSFELGPVVIQLMMKLPYGLGGKSVTIDSAGRQEFQHQTLAEVMSLEPSAYMKGYGSNGIATPAFRGTGAGHTQVYWNGLPMNAAGLGLADFSLVSPAIADQLSFVYGLPSLYLGSGGMGGAILLGNDPEEVLEPLQKSFFHQRLSQQFGSFQDSRTAYQLHVGSERLQSGTHLAFNTARNNFPFANTALPGSPEQRQTNAGFRQFSGLQEVSLKNVANGTLDASVWAFDLDRELPPTMLTLNTRERQRDRGVRSTVGWTRQVRNGYNLRLQAAWFHEALDYENPLANIQAPSRSDRFIAQGSIGERAYLLSRIFRFSGLDLRYIHDRVQTDGYPAGKNFDQMTASTGGLWNVNEILRFSFRLREEWTTSGWSPLLGVLGGSLDVKKFNLSFNAGRNYRFPSLNDLYWSPGGNPDLLPEHNWSLEGGIKRYFWKTGRDIVPFFSLDAYTNRVDNWILWVPTNAAWWAPENVQQVKVRGLEAVLALENRKMAYDQLKPDIRASYSYTRSVVGSSSDPNDESLGKQLIYTPLHAAQVMVRLRYKSWHLRYQQEYTGPRFTTRDNRESVAGYTLGNAFLGRNFAREEHLITLQLGLNNVWNVAYQNIAWRAMPGRAFFVRLQWEFKRGKSI